MLDYMKLVEEIKGYNGCFFRPEPGQYKIRVLEDPVPDEYFDEATGKITPRLSMEIELDGERKKWNFAIGKTFQSLYGQLILLGKYRMGLKDCVITLAVKSRRDKNGKTKNEYTILESLNLINQEQKKEGGKK